MVGLFIRQLNYYTFIRNNEHSYNHEKKKEKTRRLTILCLQLPHSTRSFIITVFHFCIEVYNKVPNLWLPIAIPFVFSPRKIIIKIMLKTDPYTRFEP